MSPGPEWTPVLVVLAALACLLGITLASNLLGLLALAGLLVGLGVYAWVSGW